MEKTSLSLVAAMAFVSLPAHAGEFFVMPEWGYAEVDIATAYTPTDHDESQSNYTLGVQGGYKFASNILVSAFYALTNDADIFGATDHYRVNEYGLLAGYSINLAKRFRLVPAVGYSNWDLTGSEGAFLNPGPEEKMEFEGEDIFWRLNGEIPVTRLLQINISYVRGDYDFGDVNSFRFGMKFSF